MLRREKGRATVQVGDHEYTMIVYRETHGPRWDDKRFAVSERVLVVGPRNTKGAPSKEELESQQGPLYHGMADLIGLLLRTGNAKVAKKSKKPAS